MDLAGEILLTQSFVEHEGNTVGEVERPCFATKHRDAQPFVLAFLLQSAGQATSLASKDQIIAGLIGDFAVMPRPA